MLPPVQMLTMKKRAALFPVPILTALVASLFAGCAPPGPGALLDGERLIHESKYSLAIPRLEKATQLLPRNAQAWNHLGLACHGAGRFDEAIKAYQQALALDRNLVVVHYNLGCLHLEQNDLPAALAALTSYTGLQANSAAGWTKLATVQLRARQLDAAEKSFAQALKLNPHSAEAQNGLGIVHFQRRRYQDAYRQFNAALREESDYAPALLNAAIVSQQYLNNRTLALQKYREYVAVRPTPPNAPAVEQIASRLEAELRPPSRPSATNPATQLTSLTNQQPAFAQATNKPLASSGGQKPAVAPTVPASNNLSAPAHPAASTSAPPTRVAVNTSAPPARTEAQTIPPTKVEVVQLTADEPIKPARDVLPGTTRAPNATGTVERTQPSQANRPAAQPEVGKSASPATGASERYKYRSPGLPKAGNRNEAERLLTQGVQAQERNRLSDAIGAYKKATEADPSFFDAHYNLGVASYESGNLAQTLLAYETALAINPVSVKARFNFAVALQKAGYPHDAASELETLLTNDPKEPRAHFALANLYAQQLDVPGKAREHYLRVLALEPQHPQATAIRFWLEGNH